MFDDGPSVPDVWVTNPLTGRRYNLAAMVPVSLRTFPYKGWARFMSVEFYSQKGEWDSFVLPEHGLWVHISPCQILERRPAVNDNKDTIIDTVTERTATTGKARMPDDARPKRKLAVEDGWAEDSARRTERLKAAYGKACVPDMAGQG